MKQLSKAMRSILSPLIAVKNEASAWSALLPCGLKCRGDQLGTIFPGHLICDNLAGKQVQNHTGIQIEISQLEASNIAYSNLVGLVRLELLAKNILFLLWHMELHVVLFCSAADAG